MTKGQQDSSRFPDSVFPSISLSVRQSRRVVFVSVSNVTALSPMSAH
jgi:hypothetical protein